MPRYIQSLFSNTLLKLFLQPFFKKPACSKNGPETTRKRSREDFYLLKKKYTPLCVLTRLIHTTLKRFTYFKFKLSFVCGKNLKYTNKNTPKKIFTPLAL